MKIRLTWAVPAGIVLVVAIAVLAVYGTHAFTLLGRIGNTIF
ncbi:hypothetical protein AB0C52_02105 [Streptomyces sp. NPDC048717]